MKKLILIVSIVIAGLSHSYAQSRIVIVQDPERVMTEEITTILGQKLTIQSLELTKLVDFSNKCDYLFASIVPSENELVWSIKDCEDRLLGTESVGKFILQAPAEEQAVIYFYNLVHILENRIDTQAPEQDTAEPLASSQNTDPGIQNTEHDSRYFFAPSSYSLKKNEFYYNTLYFVLHDIQAGLSDRFSIGMGTTIAGIPLYLTAKYSIPLGEKTQMALGDMMVFGTFGNDFFGNLSYLTVSHGNRFSNVSLSLGYIYSNQDFGPNQTSPLVYNLSGILQMDDYIYLLSENYFLGYDRIAYANYGSFNNFSERFTVRDRVVLGMTGLRIIRKNNELAAWQFGLGYVILDRGKYPPKYDGPNWNYSLGSGIDYYIFPMMAFTRKFVLR